MGLENTNTGSIPHYYNENIPSGIGESMPPSNESIPPSNVKAHSVERALKDLSNTTLPPAKQAVVAHISEVAQEVGIMHPQEQISPFKVLYSKSPPPGLEEIKAAKGLSKPEVKALAYFATKLSKKTLPAGISPKTIIKVLKEYYSNESLMTSRGHGYIETSKGNFVVSLNSNHKFEIVRENKTLGMGTFGVVSLMQDIFTDATHALKQPREDLKGEQAEKAKADIKNENDIIGFVHKDGIVPGIQAPGFSVTGINQANVGKAGMLGRAYDGSGTDIVGEIEEIETVDESGKSVKEEFAKRTDLPNTILGHGAYQLLQGLDYLHNIGIVHGDIRPGNCLVDYKNWNSDSTTWVLGDLGSASFADQIDMAEAKKDPVAVLTTSYLPREDQALAEKYSGYGTNAGQEDKQKFIESKMKRDVFALGQTLCEMLAFAKPYPLDEQNRPVTTNGFDQSSIEWYFTEENPQELIAVLKGMCDPNPETRLTAKEAKEQFSAWYVKTYPDNAEMFEIK